MRLTWLQIEALLSRAEDGLLGGVGRLLRCTSRRWPGRGGRSGGHDGVGLHRRRCRPGTGRGDGAAARPRRLLRGLLAVRCLLW